MRRLVTPLLLLSLAACASTSSSTKAPPTPASLDALKPAPPYSDEDEALRDVAREHTQQIANAVQLYWYVHGEYPSHDEGLSALSQPKNGKAILPLAPRDPWGREFRYRRPGIDDDEFDVFSLGPDGEANTSDDTGTWEVRKPLATEPTQPPPGPNAIQL